MTDRSEDSGETVLDVADRKMLAEITANVLGTSRVELRIGRFRVLERLGEGSMGIVFAAADDQLQRRVAIKLLHQGVGASEGERKARLFREAQILAQLEHPNIVRVYEAGEHDEQVFMVMEVVEGRALDELQRARPPVEWKALLSFYVAAGRGLAAAHAKGVVHRDFKPHNVLVDAEGRVRVVDFGLARENVGADQQLTGEVPPSREGAIEQPRVDHLTASGAVPGTPAYMAPELFDGQPASPASDQFSFCVALYEALYGRRPFEGGRLQEVIAAAKRGQILPAPADRSVPKWLFGVLARGLAPSPEARFPSMNALLAELEHDRTRRWKRAGLVLGALAVIGGTWWVRGYSGEEAAVRRHQEACREEAAALAARWEVAKGGLVRPPVEREDMDGLATVLDADAKRFFARWEGACAVDVATKLEPCRAPVQRSFEALIERGARQPLDESSFHELTYDLELCVEGGASSSCPGPESGSPAVVALGDARAAELAGNLGEAQKYLEAAITLASQAGDDLTPLRARLRQGALLETGGKIDAARPALDAVAMGALICDADVLALDALLELAEAEVLHFGELEAATSSLASAEALLEKLGDLAPPLRRARFLEKRGGAALYLQHDCESALLPLREAKTLREVVIAGRELQGLPTAHLERLAASAELNLANVAYYQLTEMSDGCRRGDMSPADVVEGYRAARDHVLAAVEHPRHFELADFEFGLGLALLETEDVEAAIAALESTLSIYRAHLQPDSPTAGDAHRALVAAYRATGKLERARQHAEANLAIRIDRGDGAGRRLERAAAHDALGLILHDQRRYLEARAELTAAIGTLGVDRAALELNELEQLYMSELNLAMVEYDLGELGEVKLAAERVRGLQRELEERTGARYHGSAQQRLVEAWVLLADGQPGEAIAHIGDIESSRGFNPSLAVRVEELHRRAAEMK